MIESGYQRTFKFNLTSVVLTKILRPNSITYGLIGYYEIFVHSVNTFNCPRCQY